jgi:hypothetical protein
MVGNSGEREGLHVEEHRALVGFGNGVVGVVGALRAPDDVAPVDADFVARFDVDDFAGHGGLEAGFAGDVGVVDVADCLGG